MLISIVDALELNQYEVKELLPHLRILNANFDRFNSLPRSFEGAKKMKEWFVVIYLKRSQK